MHSAEEQGVEMAEFEAEEQGVEMEELEAEESAESDSSHDTVNEMSDVKEILCDVASWEIPVPDHFRVEIIKRGSASFQNKDGPFSVAARQDAKAKGDVRQLSKEWFYKMMPNGEKILRSWMVYSLVSENLYYFCCRLFAVSATDATSKFVTGFQKWWKLSQKVHNHETSEEHLHCLEKWKTLAAGHRLHKTIDAETIAFMEMEKKKWRDVLHRLLDITLFLAKQNLAFRGHKEDESSLNKGNFLELVEMLSKYDPVLKEHLMRLKQSTCKLKVSVSYLPPKTQNEFISALANHVKEMLVMDIKSAKYFGIMFDSTPDISHTDQMSEVIRYVKISNRKVEVKEVFLGFFPLKGKKAADLSSDILKSLESDGLDIMMCRTQGYDNAATMAGIHGGVQAILKGKNKKAIFNGCVDHSLNLCSQHSFAENASCVTFFGTLETMFSFFAASTHRWDEVNLAQQYLQTKGLTLDKVVTKLEALRLFLHEERSHLVEHAIEQALLKSDEYGIAIRSRAIKELAAMFEGVQVKSLISATAEELKVSIPKLTTFYDEVPENELLIEIPRLRRHLKAAEIVLEEVKY
ncbi:zinc finger MYM-type protein 1-like [Rhineura floridana]|uniref:zinc finger MYM-type protein 1-like n=1 Tax=Rhineura floridana TaxID=261503 RepID=UPI002AC8611D|nr:zinc finger MYM-type protein 1-like [Rhineura floridana]